MYADNCTTDCYQNRFLPYTGDGQRDKTIIVVNTLSNTNKPKKLGTIIRQCEHLEAFLPNK